MVNGRDNVRRSRAPGPYAYRNTARQAVDGLRTEVWGQQTQSNDPHNNQHNPQYANYWAPLARKRHILPHSAQPRHTNDWALRTRKRHQREHRPQRPTERSDPTQHAKGRAGDCPGPRKETTTRRNVTQGVPITEGQMRLFFLLALAHVRMPGRPCDSSCRTALLIVEPGVLVLQVFPAQDNLMLFGGPWVHGPPQISDSKPAQQE